MAQAEVHGADTPIQRRLPGKSDEGEERRAPNGKLAVMVNGQWVGYVFEDTGGSCGRTSKEMVYFDVEKSGAGLKITRAGKISGKDKKAVSKQKYGERTIGVFEARTVTGDRCQLFTA